MFGTRSIAPPVSASRAFTCSGESTLDIMMKSGRPASTPTRSSRPPLSSGLMRTPARAPLARQSSSTSAACARAFGRNGGGVKSSSSRITASAPERPAARCAASSAPATKSQDRRNRLYIRSDSQLMLGVQALDLTLQLVQRADVGLGRGHHDVGVRAHAVDDAPALGEAHGDLALRLGSRGDGVDRVEQQLGAAFGEALDRLERGVYRPVALSFGTPLRAVFLQYDIGVRALCHPA